MLSETETQIAFAIRRITTKILNGEAEGNDDVYYEMESRSPWEIHMKHCRTMMGILKDANPAFDELTFICCANIDE